MLYLVSVLFVYRGVLGTVVLLNGESATDFRATAWDDIVDLFADHVRDFERGEQLARLIATSMSRGGQGQQSGRPVSLDHPDCLLNRRHELSREDDGRILLDADLRHGL
jgi:hypothetical protein